MWQVSFYLCLTFFCLSSFVSGGIITQNTCANAETDLYYCEYFEKGTVLSIYKGGTFWGRKNNDTCAPIRKNKYVKPKNWNCTLDIVDLLKKKCDGKTSCQFQSSNEFFGGDPCPGDRKYSAVAYECIKPSEPTTPTPTEPPEEVVHGPTVCYTNFIRINCGQKKIKTNKVFFGRGDSSTCVYGYGYFGGYFNFKCDASEVAYKYIQQKCDGQNYCDIWNIVGSGGGGVNANLSGGGHVNGGGNAIGNINASGSAQISCTPAQLPYLKISHQCVN
ncbi:unnamed protein product [Brassicogethes aeneus]|uniref:SUEL-type lectin domain-containing protein n=1 Tax=Brassicogethes aeneus TaxID=1431903 RepID=A0A9P0ALZ3_BRAAE|nr:unnamed protein product [Brassicogethes aeneus]